MRNIYSTIYVGFLLIFYTYFHVECKNFKLLEVISFIIQVKHSEFAKDVVSFISMMENKQKSDQVINFVDTI